MLLFQRRREEFLEDPVQLQQPAAALPPLPVEFDGLLLYRVMSHQTVRFTIRSLMLLMAFVGFRFFGQTSTQFMMVWQRNRRYGSSRLSNLALVAWSRVSAMNR